MNRFLAHLVTGALILPLASCSYTLKDSEYASKVVGAQTGWHGDEIVGVWVSITSIEWAGQKWRSTMQLRPDGTGKSRHFEQRIDPTGTELRLRWTYLGQGQWRIISDVARTGNFWEPFYKRHPSLVRYTGTELVCEQRLDGPLDRQLQQTVWVRAEDEAGVAEYLRRR